jgi:hypothetical protein
MTFVVDDLLVRPFFGLLKVIRAMAIEGLYDTEALRDELKENRLLFELGELTETEYEQRRADIEARLEVAEQAREQLSGRIEVRG